MSAQHDHRAKGTGTVRWTGTSWVCYKPNRSGARTQQILGRFTTRRAAEACLEKWLMSQWEPDGWDDPERS